MRIWTLALALALGQATGLTSPALAKEDPAKAEGGQGTAAPAGNQAESLEPSNFYVHRWIPLPTFTGSQLIGTGQRTIEPKNGRLTVVIFLASWCEPCQQLIPEFQQLETRYRRLDADFVYVFAHDTRDDGEGFMKEFGIKEGMLANHEILKAFHNPELPTIYVGDRHGWMLTRYPNTNTEQLGKLNGVLQTLTSY